MRSSRKYRKRKRRSFDSITLNQMKFELVSKHSMLHSVLVNTNRMTQHLLKIAELEEIYQTNVNTGLTDAQYLLALHQVGPNRIKQPTKKCKYFVRFLTDAFGGFSIVLICCWTFSVIISTLCTIMCPEIIDSRHMHISVSLSVYILIILIANGAFRTSQEIYQDRVTKQFNEGMVKYVQVVRNGVKRLVQVERLVPGDIVMLQTGDCVPADIRVLESYSFKVDDSTITGVSRLETKGHTCTDVNPLLTNNLIWSGTDVMEGNCKGMVIATGPHTLFGRIESSALKFPTRISSFRIEISNFTTFITIQAAVVAVSALIAGIIAKEDIYSTFLNFLGLLVANLPNCLQFTIAVILKLGIRRLKKLNCLVQNMHPIEMLGHTSVICLDKTGTITENNMTVSHLYYDNTIYDIDEDLRTGRNFISLCRVVILCNSTHFFVKMQARTVPLGDPFEAAAFKARKKLTRHYVRLKHDYPKIFEIPSTATSKVYISLHSRPKDSFILQVVKGTPDRVIDRCATIAIGDGVHRITESHIKQLNNVILNLGYKGERILAMADMIMPTKYSKNYPFTDEPNFPTTGLRFLGFLSFIDPAKEDVADAIVKIKLGGIKPIMLTGDNPITGTAIARKIGLISPTSDTIYDIALERGISIEDITLMEREACSAGVFTGMDIQKKSKNDIEQILRKYDELVFAALTPEQKLQIVKAYQELGETVVMVGEGVNDVYALQQADIGIAMGQLGSTVSKRAAGVILMNDKFSNIVLAIQEGRLFYDNLRKYIVYTLSSSLPKIFPYFLHILLDMPVIASIHALLLIDLATDVMPGISIAADKPEENKLDRYPGGKIEPISGIKVILHCYLGIGMVEVFAGMSTWFYTMGQYGFLPRDLIGTKQKWYSQANDLVDSYGFEWTLESRINLQNKGSSAYFLGVVITQVVNALFVTKYRTQSVFKHGINNIMLLKSVLAELAIAACVVFIPYVNWFMGFESIHVSLLWPAFVFAMYILIFEEIRKAYIRSNPDSWIARNTY